MDVQIINFPETKIAVFEHRGAPELEHESIKKLISWRIESKLLQSPAHRSYGIHYNDPLKVPPSEYRVDLCISVETDVPQNSYGIITRVIPACRCATARHLGSRENVTAAQYLYNEWLPSSGEQLAEFPIFFHYVNVGPQLQENEMITDVYLPIV